VSAAVRPDDAIRRIVFIGDSVTDCGRRDDPDGLGSGYVADLARRWGDRDDLLVVNTGVSGHRIPDLEARVQADVVDHGPDLVSVMVGINDTWRRFDASDPTSTADYEASYRRFLDAVTATKARLVLMEPFLLPVRTEQQGWREDLEPKIDVVRRLADLYGAVLVRTDRALNTLAVSVGAATLADDGVHPTAQGHVALADLWSQTVFPAARSIS